MAKRNALEAVGRPGGSHHRGGAQCLQTRRASLDGGERSGVEYRRNRLETGVRLQGLLSVRPADGRIAPLLTAASWHAQPAHPSALITSLICSSLLCAEDWRRPAVPSPPPLHRIVNVAQADLLCSHTRANARYVRIEPRLAQASPSSSPMHMSAHSTELRARVPMRGRIAAR